MKALTYHGAKDVRVESVPDPVLEHEDDIVIRITATAICGSDLHLYRGKVPGLKDGDILGHEFMGVVEDAGRGVTRLRKGDRVVVPFVIACGDCFFCERRLYAACETTSLMPELLDHVRSGRLDPEAGGLPEGGAGALAARARQLHRAPGRRRVDRLDAVEQRGDEVVGVGRGVAAGSHEIRLDRGLDALRQRALAQQRLDQAHPLPVGRRVAAPGLQAEQDGQQRDAARHVRDAFEAGLRDQLHVAVRAHALAGQLQRHRRVVQAAVHVVQQQVDGGVGRVRQPRLYDVVPHAESPPSGSVGSLRDAGERP